MMLRSLRSLCPPTTPLQRSFFTSVPSRSSHRPSLFINHLNRAQCRHQSSTIIEESRAKIVSMLTRQAHNKKIVVWSCIAANVTVFLAWMAARTPIQADATPQKRMEAVKLFQEMSTNFLLTRDNIQQGRVWTIISSGFSHIELGHLFFNMFAFHQLSQVIIYTPGLGLGKLLTLIFGSITAGSGAWLVHENAAPANSRKPRAALGFSAAVMGVISAAACLQPYQTMLLFGVVPIPLWALGIGYAAYDTYSVGSDSRTAHDAHIGGAVFGGLYYMFVLRRFGGIMGPKMPKNRA